MCVCVCEQATLCFSIFLPVSTGNPFFFSRIKSIIYEGGSHAKKKNKIRTQVAASWPKSGGETGRQYTKNHYGDSNQGFSGERGSIREEKA